MSIYTEVLFQRETLIDDVLESPLVKSAFEISGFLCMENLEPYAGADKEAFEYARPRYTKFGTVEDVQTKIDAQYTAEASIINEVGGNAITEVKSSWSPTSIPILSPDVPQREKLMRMYLENMAMSVTSRFDQVLLNGIVGNNEVGYDKLKDGTFTPAAPKDLPTDSGRAAKTQATDLKAAFTSDQGKKLMDELNAAALLAPEMTRNNDEVYVLLPYKAFLAYWNVFSIAGDVTLVNRKTFRSGYFTFVSFPTVGFPTTTGVYNCAMLPKNAAKFFILVNQKQGEIVRDEVGNAILDRDGMIQRPVSYNPFFVIQEEKHTTTTNESTRGTVLTVSKRGGSVRYRPDFVQAWNIPDSVLPV